MSAVQQRWDNDRWEWVDIPADDVEVSPVGVVEPVPVDWEFVDDIPDGAGLSVGLSNCTYFTADPGDTPGDLPDDWSYIRPDPEPPTEKPDRSAHVECWLGGGLVAAKRASSGGPRKQVGGGIRGSITRFSFASRRRLMRRLAQTKRAAIPLFVTLTYPDYFPADPAVWKNDLKKFSQRLARRFPAASFVWRLHTIARKSGDNAGEIAPHYHLLVWGVGLADMRGFTPKAWYQVVASGDEKHLRAGTSVEMPRSFKSVMKYVANEIAKVEQSTPVDDVGRWWGFYHRALIPWAELVRFPVADQDVVKFFRWFRRHAGLWSASYKSLSIFCNADFWHTKIRAGPGPPVTYPGVNRSAFRGKSDRFKIALQVFYRQTSGFLSWSQSLSN